MPEVNPNPMNVSADVLGEVLLRLPLKSLVKFKTVSKEWRSMLESKWFLERHLSFQKSGMSRRRILAADHCDCGAPPSLLPRVGFQGDEEIVYLHCESTRPSMSCDGLVCIPEPGWINVLNPSTGQRRRFSSGPDPVPTPRNRRVSHFFTNGGAWLAYFPGYWAMGFGRDKVNGSYKVVRMFFDPNIYDVLNVNTGEWRKLISPPPYEVEAGRRSACVNGSVYWFDIWRGCRLLALDLHTEEFRDVPLGADMIFTMDTQIVNLEDHLAIAIPRLNIDRERELEIWTMDGTEERWSKTYSINLASMGLNLFEERSFKPVIMSKEGDIVIYDNNKNLFRYYQRTNTIRQISPCTCVISPYLENLVRLGNEQVELRTDSRCLLKHGVAFAHVVSYLQSRVDKFVSEGKYLGVLLASYYMYALLLCYLFCTGETSYYMYAFNSLKAMFTILLLKLFTILDRVLNVSWGAFFR